MRDTPAGQLCVGVILGIQLGSIGLFVNMAISTKLSLLLYVGS